MTTMTEHGRFYWALDRSYGGLIKTLASGTLTEVLAARKDLKPDERRRARLNFFFQGPDYVTCRSMRFTLKEARQLLREGGTV